jgi:hypothetical protein
LSIAILAHAPRATANAQVEVTLNANPRELQVGQTFRLEVRATVKGGSLEALTLEDLKKYPELEVVSHQTARPMQLSFGFGSGMKIESSLSHEYGMRALAPGTFEFSPAVAKVDGKLYESDPLTVVVLPSNQPVPTDPAEPTPPPDDGDALSGARYDPRAFLRTVVEPQSVYVGQQVDVTIYLYSRIGISGRSVNPTKPTMDGFWVYDEPITGLEGTIATFNGVRFRAYVLQQSAAFPQRTGELTIGAPKVTFDTDTASLFDAPEQVTRTGVPVTIDVEPLPQPGPANAFVGKYTLRSSLDRQSVKTGNAVTLRVEATGVGNIQDLRIDLPPIKGVRALQPVTKNQQRFYGDTLGGTRSWEWILIPEVPGEHTIPPIRLEYFDPETEQYGATSTEAMVFSSTGAAAAAQPTVSPVDATPAPAPAKFGPIRMYSALTRESTPVRERSWFGWLLALPPLLFATFTIGLSLARRRKRRQATSGAVQRQLFQQVRDALRRNDPRAFYDGVVAAITHAVTARIDEPIRGLSNTELRSRLLAGGFDEDLVQRVINELEGADFARFAASGVDTTEMQRCLERTRTIVERIQRLRGAS